MKTKNHKSDLREKTRTEALADGSIDKLSSGQLHELVGWVELEKNGHWEVTTIPKGTGYHTESQQHAEIIASLEEIKHMLVKLLKSVGKIK